MDTQEFMIKQYLTLREEIKETKSRIFNILGIAIIGIPAASFLAYSYRMEIILLVPILVVVILLLYLSENHALMRCGRYIRLHIEPQYTNVVGWEKWLETPDEFKTRTVDTYMSYCFYLLFFVYFVGSVFLAAQYVQKNYGIIPLSILLGVYVSVGIWVLAFVIHNIRTTTTTKTA